MTIARIKQGTVTVVRVPHRDRLKADVRDVAIRVNQSVVFCVITWRREVITSLRRVITQKTTDYINIAAEV